MLKAGLPADTLDDHVKSWPSRLLLTSACSGSGSFELAASAAVEVADEMFGRDFGTEVAWHLI